MSSPPPRPSASGGEGRRPRRPTTTSTFGVGRRESHDASDFYARFAPPVLDDDDAVADPVVVDQVIGAMPGDRFKAVDARTITRHVPPGSVALVVTSPPYFVGKAYEEELERDGIPASYAEYLTMLSDVFAECVEALEPGGRIAVNVANLGRRPYRSLSSDVIRIFERLGLLLRGEVLWKKANGAGGNCAWGSYMQPTNPTLRDITERVVVASKGRFERALTARQREARGLPHRSTSTADLYMESTLDLWDIPAESARRVGHPAPFPVELPERLIHLYTWVDDLVLDPFMGAGSTLVAAALTDRRYVGFDLDPAYVDLARRRVGRVLSQGRPRVTSVAPSEVRSSIPVPPPDEDEDFQARATREGKAAMALAERVLTGEGGAGFALVRRKVRLRGLGAEFNLHVKDQAGDDWYVDVSGASFTNPRGGLRRSDTVWKALGRAHVFARHLEAAGQARLLLLTSHLPRARSEGDLAIRAVGPRPVFDVIAMLDDAGRARLAAYAQGGYSGSDGRPSLPGYWTSTDVACAWRP